MEKIQGIYADLRANRIKSSQARARIRALGSPPLHVAEQRLKRKRAEVIAGLGQLIATLTARTGE